MRPRLAAFLCMLLAALAFEPTARAQTAIAFAQAPEMSSGVCAQTTIRKALDCATRKCVANGGTTEDCVATTACFPAGWAIDVFVQISDGPHWHETFCGFDSRETAVEASKAVCRARRRATLLECTLVALYDDDGAVARP